MNLEKSNLVVFRNGGYLARREKWYYKDSIVKDVNAYTYYLGMWFSIRLSFSHSLESQTAKAKADIVEMLKTLWKLGDVSPNIFLKLFDSQIKPISLYGSEIWANGFTNTKGSLVCFEKTSKRISKNTKRYGIRGNWKNSNTSRY